MSFVHRQGRLKDFAFINESSLAASTDDDYLIRYVEISNVDSNGVISEDAIETLRFEEAPSRARRRVRAENTIISSVRPNLQSMAYFGEAEDNLICSTGFNVVAPRFNYVSGRFLYYVLKTNDSLQHFVATAKGVGYPAVDEKDFNSLKVELPAPVEQTRIAQYLDQTCAAIDRAIAIKQEQLGKLDQLRKSIIYKAVTKGLDDSVEMRESGVEWIGEVPAHWDVRKLRYEITINSGDFASDILSDEGDYPVIGGNGEMGRTWKNNVQGDVLAIGRVGAQCGNVHYVANEAWISDNALVVESIHDKLFLLHALRALDLNADANKTAQPVITGTKIKAKYIGFPPPDEQTKIVKYIDSSLNKLNSLGETLNEQIKTLDEYKRSLIHECVTGKRRITEAAQKNIA